MTTPKPKAYRRQFIRDKTPPPLQLQDRDLALIQTVQENRLATVPILARFFPPDPTARERTTADPHHPAAPYSNLHRRLAKLFHHGYLLRFRTVLGGQHIYALDTKGAELLTQRQLSLFAADWQPKKDKTPSTLFVDHTLMVANFRASLQHALLRQTTYALADFQREGLDLKAVWRRGSKRIYVNPDAFFTLKDTTTNVYIPFFLEADRSTMQHHRMLEKYHRYALMHQDGIHKNTFGVQTFNVLTVCKSTERAANILTLTADETSTIPAHLKHLFYFTTDTTYTDTPTNTLAAIWRRADDIEKPRAIVTTPLPRRTT